MGPERAVLIEAASLLNEKLPATAKMPQASRSRKSGRPGDEYNDRGDVQDVLRQHGWTQIHYGEGEYWRRPGKDHGWSATLRNRIFYVFSTNAAPFEPDRGYLPFHVYTLLECDGDFHVAAKALRGAGYSRQGGGVVRVTLIRRNRDRSLSW